MMNDEYVFFCPELLGCRSGPGRFALQSAKNMYMMNLDIVVYLENKLLLISINVTPKTSHSWYTMFSRYVYVNMTYVVIG